MGSAVQKEGTIGQALKFHWPAWFSYMSSILKRHLAYINSERKLLTRMGDGEKGEAQHTTANNLKREETEIEKQEHVVSMVL